RKSRKELVDEEIMILVLIDPERIDVMTDDLLSSFLSPIKDILLKIKQKKDIKTEELIQTFKDDMVVVNYITYLIMKAETRREAESDIEGEFEHCLVERELLSNKLGRNRLSGEIKELEKKGDFEKIKILLEEFNKLSYNKNEEANQESPESEN
ncbi:hypothetical protein M0Q03_01315, partial [bacterium]|nr:hypothetical protein [bacterium]